MPLPLPRFLDGAVAGLTLLLFSAGVSTASAADAAKAAAGPISWSQLQALPLPPPGERIAYGKATPQFGELRLPSGTATKAGWPVFVLIHGGCWQAEYDYVYFTRLAAWMTAQGIATWTIEYRRLGDEGGGWPGTFTDVGTAIDQLRDIARTHPLDLARVHTAGHSAGGQLALWAAARSRLPATSELHVDQPLPIRGVLGLAAITDLDTYRIGPPDSCNASVDPLLGGTPDTQAARYAQTSPLRLLPLGVPQVFVQGGKDPIVKASDVDAYARAAKRAGDAVTVLPIDTVGHFDVAVPIPASEPSLRAALDRLLKGH